MGQRRGSSGQLILVLLLCLRLAGWQRKLVLLVGGEPRFVPGPQARRSNRWGGGAERSYADRDDIGKQRAFMREATRGLH